MKLENNTFPYPVLSLNTEFKLDNEFLPGNFFSVEVSDNIIGQSKYELTIQYKLNNDDLQALINDGKAQVIAHMESGLTSFRTVIPFENNQDILIYEIDDKKIVDTIDLTVMIIANVALDSYSNNGFNNELYGDNFIVQNIVKGDILAFAPTIEIKLEVEDVASKGTRTFIKIAKSSETLLSIDLDSDDIRIKLPEKAYEIYGQLQNAKEIKLANTTLLLPALMMAIDDIKDEESSNNIYLWNKELSQFIFDKLKYNKENIINVPSIEVAQKILNNPVIEAFTTLVGGEE